MRLRNVVIIALLIIGLFYIVDKRLKVIEVERCKMWNWEVCEEILKE